MSKAPIDADFTGGEPCGEGKKKYPDGLVRLKVLVAVITSCSGDDWNVVGVFSRSDWAIRALEKASEDYPKKSPIGHLLIEHDVDLLEDNPRVMLRSRVDGVFTPWSEDSKV